MLITATIKRTPMRKCAVISEKCRKELYSECLRKSQKKKTNIKRRRKWQKKKKFKVNSCKSKGRALTTTK